ncbi:SDR family NAD(P)-dependent oxidoreductase [Paramicrobacterium chengjingii]|uniref:SDR family NAD(P)-dependent oxidoreductase n=1 Tax=Paramicrobacterium chengjingii TaxID=2769067 RepID=UPI00141E78A3|nr:SDR family NAD(P)-dependent oxidoreductase [Microbacterium chengjingii]
MNTLAVVGAGPQLGMSIARRFAREGFSIALLARREEPLERLAAMLRDDGHEAAAFPADVSDPDSLRSALRAAEERLGGIDVLEFSPAPTKADMLARPLIDASEVTVESVLPEFDMYIRGGITAVRSVLPGMLSRGTGTIIFTTEAGSGPMIVPRVANVQIATGGLRNWALNLHESLRERGVYVGHVALAAAIGHGGPAAEPDTIADAYWKLHTERIEPELVYDALPDDWQVDQVADKFTVDERV